LPPLRWRLQKMAQAVEAKALEINVPVVFSVVDRGGIRC
jgi:uncharacterized protein GlcG (DUF336 family)